MSHFIRALSTTLLALASITAVACSGGGDQGGQGGSTGDGSTGNGTTASSTGSAASTGSGAGAIAWPGTWTVDLSYSVSCDVGFGTMKTGMWTQTDTLVLTDAGGGGLSVSFPNNVNYGMSGTGNDHMLALSGQYPAKDDGGGAASTAQDANSVTLKIDTIQSVNAASGSMSGTFVGQFGQKCTISAGTASFSR